jgi:HlyD family secretion protein
MKKKTVIIILIIVVVVAAILVKKGFSKKGDEFTFETVKVESAGISNIVEATGTVEAITSVDVGTQVSGIIQRVYVDFNQNVKEGQLLAKLDETSLLAQLQQSQSSVDQAQAQLNYMEATYKRTKALYEKDLIAQGDYDQALYNYENSKASISNAKSALARAKVNLDYATITSPIDGVVLNRAVEEGQTVAASFNTPTLFTIVNDLTQMEVQTNIDEADIGIVKQGQRVEFNVDAYPDLKFKGVVSEVRLQPVTTNNVVTYVVILRAQNPDKKLMPGLTASVKIFIEEKEKTLVVSGKSIRFTPDAAYMMKLAGGIQKDATGKNKPKPPDLLPNSNSGSFLPDSNSAKGVLNTEFKMVWVKDEKGGARPVPVKIGITSNSGSDIEILSGLKEGDEVIISMNSGTAKFAPPRQGSTPPGPMPF